ncbi:hypothetical protein [Labilibacter marinus]|uniref:hypothetical protein n=1 Tax=Labilibacter marinus TaxID=1477105 RepID=UPI00083739BD|nr:hypothetical protein [Labilibacter marinus]
MRSRIEIFTAFFSIIIGIKLLLESAWYIYAYNFSSILFLVMTPMISLIYQFIMGILLISSGYYLFKHDRRSVLLYKLTGTLIMLYPANQYLLTRYEVLWTDQNLYLFLIAPLGLFLYFFILQKKYRFPEKNINILKLEKVSILIGISIVLLINILFHSWNYLDRVL